MKKKKAYSYRRFSSGKQSKGSSIQRQGEKAIEFSKRHNLELVDVFTDSGVSAWKGKNFSPDFALGKFYELAQKGTIEKGAVLIVENLDRLSREEITDCAAKFLQIVNSGIAIGLVDKDVILDKEAINKNWTLLLVALAEMATAGEENTKRSERVKKAFRLKIESIKSNKKIFLGTYSPSWITGLEDGEFTVNEAVVKTIKEIFRRYLAGESSNHIANTLNKNKVPTLRGKAGKVWNTTSVALLLRSKSVIGTLTSKIHSVEKDNYYPAIISGKDFATVQTQMDKNIVRRTSHKTGMVLNLFRGLLFCETCGQAIDLHVSQYRPKNKNIVYYTDYCCHGAKFHSGCINSGNIKTETTELALFVNILFHHPASLISRTKPKDDFLDTLESSLLKKQLLIDRYLKMFQDTELAVDESLQGQYKQTKADYSAIQKQIQDHKAKAMQIDSMPGSVTDLQKIIATKSNEGMTEWVKSFKAFNKNQENRAKLRALMPRIFEKITLKFTKGVTDINCTLIDGQKLNVKTWKENGETHFK